MKDNIPAPTLGRAPDKYDALFFDRAFRNIENSLKTILSVGPIRVSDISNPGSYITMSDLPTVDPGVPGALWNNAGVVTVSP
jgi:hypothetical protein